MDYKRKTVIANGNWSIWLLHETINEEINSELSEPQKDLINALTALQVLISIFPFRYSSSFSKFPARAALKKLELLSVWITNTIIIQKQTEAKAKEKVQCNSNVTLHHYSIEATHMLF